MSEVNVWASFVAVFGALLCALIVPIAVAAFRELRSDLESSRAPIGMSIPPAAAFTAEGGRKLVASYEAGLHRSTQEGAIEADELSADRALWAVDPEFAASLGIAEPLADLTPVTGHLRRGAVPVLTDGVIVLRVPPPADSDPGYNLR